MRRTPIPGLDLSVYAKAIPLLLRNPSIIVVPLLMAVIGVLIGMVTAPYGGGIVTSLTSGLGAFIAIMLELFGLGAACIIADDAWRNGRASFDRGWTEARRRGGDLLFAALGVTLLLSIGQYAATIVGPFALVLIAAIIVFLIWTMPAAAVGGVPGGGAIQASIDRVRSAPLSAALAAIVSVLLVNFAAPILAFRLDLLILPYVAGSTIVGALLSALLQSIAIGYIALILTKTYTDEAFGSRRW